MDYVCIFAASAPSHGDITHGFTPVHVGLLAGISDSRNDHEHGQVSIADPCDGIVCCDRAWR